MMTLSSFLKKSQILQGQTDQNKEAERETVP